MIFFSKYSINTDKSRYECLKAFLDRFSTLDDINEDKEFFGSCEEAVFSFKPRHPNSPLYMYSPKYKIEFNECKGGTKISVKSSALMLLFTFILCVLFAALFLLMLLLISDMRLIIGVLLSLALAFLFAFLSARAILNTRKLLQNIIE